MTCTKLTRRRLTISNPDRTLVKVVHTTGVYLGRGTRTLGVLTMEDGSGAARWRRSSRCYAGNCVEVSARSDRVLIRDSKHPELAAIALAYSDWAVFMDLVRDARWGASFDLIPAVATRTDDVRPVGAGRRPNRVLV